MSEEASLSQRILDAAETVLRRHGVEKTNVVDVARALGMSHGNIYRHFPSKKALLEAVVTRWVQAVTDPLDLITDDRTRSASERLTAWLNALSAAKRQKLRDDPELFRMHYHLVESAREVVLNHIETMLRQLERIISDGVASGEFNASIILPRPPERSINPLCSFIIPHS